MLTYQLFIDFKYPQPDNAIKAFFMINNCILRGICFQIDYAALFPIRRHRGWDNYLCEGINYSIIQKWKSNRESILLELTPKKTYGYEKKLLDIVVNDSDKIEDDLGLPVYDFPDVKILRRIEIPSTILNIRYPLVGKNHYAPYSTNKDCYCVLFAELDNQYDKKAIKVLRWIPTTKNKLIQEIKELKTLKTDLSSNKVKLKQSKEGLSNSKGENEWEEDVQKRIKIIESKISKKTANIESGNHFYELGYISRTYNPDLHTIMVNGDSRILFAKIENNFIKLIGGYESFLHNDLCFPKCLINIPME